MTRKQFILGIFVGFGLVIYYLLRKLGSFIFNSPAPPPMLNLPIIAGTIISIFSFILLGFKNGFVTIILIGGSFLIESYLEKSRKEVRL